MNIEYLVLLGEGRGGGSIVTFKAQCELQVCIATAAASCRIVSEFAKILSFQKDSLHLSHITTEHLIKSNPTIFHQ